MAPLNETMSRRLSMSKRRNDENFFDVKYKVLLLGDTLVGKTSLQRSIVGKDFRTDIGATIGVDFVNKIIPVEQSKINLQIWDTAGQRNFRTIGKGYYSSSKAFVLVYDVTNIESFRLIEFFSQLIDEAGLDLERRYLVANKIDLVENRKIDEDVGQRFALRNSMTYFETSCKTGENIEEFFEQIASDLVLRHHPTLLDSHSPVINNFAFNYHVPPTIDHRLSQRFSQMFVDEQKLQKSKKKNIRFYHFLICCRPRRTIATND